MVNAIWWTLTADPKRAIPAEDTTVLGDYRFFHFQGRPSLAITKHILFLQTREGD